MRTYWDLSEKERAALSREDVERFADAELMLKGVLKAPPAPELEPVPAVTPPETTVYRVRDGKYDEVDIAFRTPDDAKQFLALRPLHLGSEWIQGTQVQSLKEFEKPEIYAAQLHTKERLDLIKVDLRRELAVREENDRRTRARADAIEAQDKALEGMWSDWYACQEKAARMKRVVDTFNDYLRIAGERDVAGVFLVKSFSRQEVIDAAAWMGIEIPTEPYPQEAKVEAAR